MLVPFISIHLNAHIDIRCLELTEEFFKAQSQPRIRAQRSFVRESVFIKEEKNIIISMKFWPKIPSYIYKYIFIRAHTHFRLGK